MADGHPEGTSKPILTLTLYPDGVTEIEADDRVPDAILAAAVFEAGQKLLGRFIEEAGRDAEAVEGMLDALLRGEPPDA